MVETTTLIVLLAVALLVLAVVVGVLVVQLFRFLPPRQHSYRGTVCVSLPPC